MESVQDENIMGLTMKVIKGKSVHGGLAIGKILYYEKNQKQVRRKGIVDPELEEKRLEEARKETLKELQQLYEHALTEVGQVNAQIFQVHQVMLEDLDYLEAIRHIIRAEKVNAEFAVATVGDNFSQMFQAMEDEYMQERASDVKDVSERLVAVLQGRSSMIDLGEEPVILVAEDLVPSETVQMDKKKVQAIVTRQGTTHSHTAILARSMGIPALIRVDFPEEIQGKSGIVDGYTGEFFVEPEAKILRIYDKKQQEEIEKRVLLEDLKGLKNETKSGRKIHVFANIGSVADVADVLANDAGGIGLFRSEFLYLERDSFPGEEEQFHAYKAVAQNMAGKKVIIRTLDLGADKQVDYFNLGQEENPAMGYRAIRICLKEPEIFKTQLRAILRASNYGNLSIMYPMITSLEELWEIRKIMQEVKEDLKSKGIPFRDLEEGVMIETPASAIIADQLAKEVDFFSIGTNDLSQYVLAIDRQNGRIEAFYNSHHPAILRLISWVVEAGHKEGCFVGICGELAGDLELTKTFLDMGVDELSVVPSRVLPLRQKIRNLD